MPWERLNGPQRQDALRRHFFARRRRVVAHAYGVLNRCLEPVLRRTPWYGYPSAADPRYVVSAKPRRRGGTAVANFLSTDPNRPGPVMPALVAAGDIIVAPVVVNAASQRLWQRYQRFAGRFGAEIRLTRRGRFFQPLSDRLDRRRSLT